MHWNVPESNDRQKGSGEFDVLGPRDHPHIQPPQGGTRLAQVRHEVVAQTKRSGVPVGNHPPAGTDRHDISDWRSKLIFFFLGGGGEGDITIGMKHRA